MKEEDATIRLNAITAGRGVSPSYGQVKWFAEANLNARNTGGGDYSEADIGDYLAGKGYTPDAVRDFLEKYRMALAECERAK